MVYSTILSYAFIQGHIRFILQLLPIFAQILLIKIFQSLIFFKVINVFLVVCWNETKGSCEEQVPPRKKSVWWLPEKKFENFLQRTRVLLQTKTLIKTLSFFTSRPLSIYILNNDNVIFQATILNYQRSDPASDLTFDATSDPTFPSFLLFSGDCWSRWYLQQHQRA